MLGRVNRKRRPSQEFKVGDWVFVDAEKLPDPGERSLPAKLRSPYSGPFEVTGVSQDNLRIDLPAVFGKGSVLVNKEDVFRFTGDLPSEEGILVENLSEQPEDASELEAEDPGERYEVEAILRWKFKPGRQPRHQRSRPIMYLVKWKEAASPTWQSEEEVDGCEDLLRAFWVKQANAGSSSPSLPPQSERFLS